VEKALLGYRTDPWPQQNVMATTLDVARRITQRKDGQMFGVRLDEILREPFAVKLLDSERMVARLQTAHDRDRGNFAHFTREVVAEFEPHVPWTEEFLRLRVQTYELAGDERLELAKRDLRNFEEHDAPPLVIGTREQMGADAAHRQKRPGSSLFGPVPVQAREK
jgi:hypothetical protein